MIRAAAVIVLTLALAGVAQGAATVNVNQALTKAKTCLLAHGARSVGWSNRGGSVSFAHQGYADWFYLTTKAYPLNTAKVLGVKSYSFPLQYTAATRLVVKRCVVASTKG